MGANFRDPSAAREMRAAAAFMTMPDPLASPTRADFAELREEIRELRKLLTPPAVPLVMGSDMWRDYALLTGKQGA